MNKRNLSGILILFLGIALSSCRPEIDLERPGDYEYGYAVTGEEDFSQEFKGFWSAMNHYYLYWNVDGVNWDTIYDV